jgi:hypothetical protein
MIKTTPHSKAARLDKHRMTLSQSMDGHCAVGLDIGHLQKQLDDSLREITMLKSKKVMTEEAEKENMNLKV